MYCPSCGSKNTTDQRFCRNCGLNLESAAQSLLEQFPKGDRPDLDRRERRIEKFGQIAFGGFVTVVGLALLALIFLLFQRMVLSGEQPWVGMMLIAFLVFAALTLTFVVLREDLKDKRKAAGTTLRVEDRNPEIAPVTARLIEEKQFVPIPTVTEHTTELLQQERPRQR